MDAGAYLSLPLLSARTDVGADAVRMPQTRVAEEFIHLQLLPECILTHKTAIAAEHAHVSESDFNAQSRSCGV